jgi:OFA family oxalate/formate antiporter-like MFS transporter
MARLGGTIEDVFGSLKYAFWISGALLIVAVILARITKRPAYAGEQMGAAA